MKKRLTKVAIGNKEFQIPKKEAGAILKLVESIERANNQRDLIPANEVFKGLLDKKPQWALHLRGARYKENLSQQELSDRTGIPITTISKYENGERRISEKQAKKLATALRISFKLFIQE